MALILSNTYEYIDVKYEEVLASMQDCADFQLHITARDTPELAEFALSDGQFHISSSSIFHNMMPAPLLVYFYR
tara:strand:+ start:366 stop:587 length:222 start_codon:yes stop_codon:yes gene_type:complete